jgi:peptide/nickel transport system ATP-binding protein
MNTTIEDPPYLRVVDLKVRFDTDDGQVRAVEGVNFTVRKGQTLGIVGESGSGKSVTSLSIMGLHDTRRTRISGEIHLGSRQLVGLPEPALRKLRGSDMAMIFQDPLSALHPYYTVGKQLVEAYQVHHPDATRAQARKRAVDMLGRVGIPQPERRFSSYPHEFSGGMRQRVMIAMALMNDPALLIADEPTTALDVTVQAQILDLLEDLQREFNSAVILITHDMGVVAQVADDVLVMYAGRVIEYGTVEQVLREAHHPYTWGLLASIPSLHGDAEVDLKPIKGNPPSLINVPPGCAFHPRCAYALVPGACADVVPDLLELSSRNGHKVACHLPESRRVRTYEEEIAHVGVAQ